MDKAYASFRLGGEDHAARWIGISPAVYKEWPERLHRVMQDRVYAAVLRKETAAALGLTAKQFFADVRGETVIESMLTRVSIAAIMANMLERVPAEFERRDETTSTHNEPAKVRRKPPASLEMAGV